MLETGFAVGPRLNPAIMDCKAINDKLCTLRMRGKFYNISFINVHAPTEEKEEEEKDVFYGRLARTINACPRHDLIIIRGDFNAKVGKEPMYRQYTGCHSLHEHSNYLVGLVIRCRTARPRTNGGRENTQPRLNTDSLRDITVQQEFKAALEESLLPENSYETTSERWNALKTKIINCARNILPPRRGNTKSGWFDDECRQMTKRKNTAYRAMQQRHRTRACAEKYTRLRREEKRVHRSKKHALK